MSAVAMEISRAVAGVLAEADGEIAGRGAVCRGSGRCCRFEEWGHRLYVTGVELVHFGEIENRKLKIDKASAGAGGLGVLGEFFLAEVPRGCPYQMGNLCGAREGRPLGCRVYFCEAGAQGWQSEVYERYHGQLRAIHERLGVPYRYLEWREALREIAGGT